MKTLSSLIIAAALGCACLFSPLSAPVAASDCTRTSVGLTPLNDLGTGGYLGFMGGLYPNGSNLMPPDHLTAGLVRARRIQPLDANGNPSLNGKYVLLSVGMSNTSNEFCAPGTTISCTPETFLPRAVADPSVNRSTLVIVNGAQGGRDASSWTSPTANTYDVVRDQRLSALQVTEKQVQIVWLKQANAGPTISLPNSSADAYNLKRSLGMIVRALKVRYPNLQQVFVSNRIYAGYASTTLNPEPYAYESGFAVKWLIEAQISQMRGGAADPRAGDLNYNTVAPWIAWGPNLWANGLTPRSDGLTYVCSDLNTDGTHPAESGRRKVATLLLNFFKRDSTTRTWFLSARRSFADFDGDGRADPSVFRPADRFWYMSRSTAGFQAVQFGLSTDTPAPADFDEDGKTDIAVFRDGVWYWLRSSDGTFSAVQFGAAGDRPQPADFTGDGRAELAVYRGGTWWTFDLATGHVNAVQFGLATDRTVPADFDGDGRTDYAVYRDGIWYVLGSTQGFAVFQFGLAGDTPVVGDYDGDGKADAAVYREGTWYLLRSSEGFAALQFGLATDQPAPGDFDGDGRTDAAVYRDGVWYLLQSQQGFLVLQFGLAGDQPIPSAFIP